MRNFLPKTLLPAAVFASAIALLSAPQTAAAQQTKPASTAATAAPANQEHDGIKVHGWWTIVVKNPDGSIAEKREFENSLQNSGGTALASVLSGNLASGNWAIEFGNNNAETTGGPCSGGPCVITVQGSGFVNSFGGSPIVATGLQVTADGPTVTLQGSHVANQNGLINVVNTDLGTCSAGTAPASCDEDTNYTFTSKLLSTAISVTSGQSIDVTVLISFS